MDTPAPRNRNSRHTKTVRWYMARKNNLSQKLTPLRLWTSKEQNVSRASSAPSYIMLEPWTKSYLSTLLPSYHSRPPPHNAPMKPSIEFWITAQLTPPMAFSIALATWSYVHILMQGYTIRAMDEADPERIFSLWKGRHATMERISDNTWKNH